MAARKNTTHAEKTKDEIRGTQLINLLSQFANTGLYNGKPVDSNRIAAARAALPFLRPTLQAVEQTNVSQTDKMSEEELLGMATALISSHPELIAQLNLAPKPVQVDAETGIKPLSEVSKTA